jgi:isopentenyldiphosphate isomerase
MESELLYLVDKDDNVVGSHLRDSETYNLKKNFRVINAFIINSKGELWIPRRTAHKRLFPLALDVSCGGHVTFGDSYEDTLRKEVQEELNMMVNAEDCELLGYLNPHDEGHEKLSAFMKVYLIKSDQTPKYNPDDFIEDYWLKPSELVEKIEGGEPAKGDLVLLVKRFFS